MSKALSMLVCGCLQVSIMQQPFFLQRKEILQLATEKLAKMQNTDRACVLSLLKLPLWGRLASSLGRPPACQHRQASLQEADRL